MCVACVTWQIVPFTAIGNKDSNDLWVDEFRLESEVSEVFIQYPT